MNRIFTPSFKSGVPMTTLITFPSRLNPEKIQETSLLKIEQSMGSRHMCPCCSHALLRHICLGKLYWRCNYCYQAMPVMEEARERPLFLANDALFHQELIDRKALCHLWELADDEQWDSTFTKYKMALMPHFG